MFTYIATYIQTIAFSQKPVYTCTGREIVIGTEWLFKFHGKSPVGDTPARNKQSAALLVLLVPGPFDFPVHGQIKTLFSHKSGRIINLK